MKRAKVHVRSVSVCFLFLLQTLSGFAQSGEVLSDTLLADGYSVKGRSFLKEVNFDSASFYLQKASHIYGEAGAWAKSIDCLDLAADSYRRAGRFEDGLELGNTALDLVYEKIGKGNLIEAEVLNTLGTIYDYKGDYEKALDYSN